MPDAETARTHLLAIVHRDPQQFGVDGSRWSLTRLQSVVDWLAACHPASVSRLLERLDVRYKRGRVVLHSPDPDYLAKLERIEALLAAVQASQGQQVGCYLDEFTYYRQPTVARAYASRGHDQARTEQSHRHNTPTRVLAALNVVTGRVHAVQGKATTLPTFVRFYQHLRAAYPQAQRLHVILDNWPVHTHPDLLVGLEPQTTPFPSAHPPSWPTTPSARGRRRWRGQPALPIQLVPLPTYAPWTNPIEDLWRWLYAEVLHLHRLADDLPALRARVLAFLGRFTHGSPALLRYVGLLSPA